MLFHVVNFNNFNTRAVPQIILLKNYLIFLFFAALNEVKDDFKTKSFFNILKENGSIYYERLRYFNVVETK